MSQNVSKILPKSYKEKIIRLIKNPEFIVLFLNNRGFSRLISDELYVKALYKYRMDRELDLNNPQTFSDKIQWLKLYDRRLEYNMFVDKYEVRKFIRKKIGKKYLIPLLGVWDRFEDIDFSKLPKQFVLKCTHDSQSVVICKDKDIFNIKEAGRKFNKYLKRNIFWSTREWPYKDLKPRIIAEEYLVDNKKIDLRDNKFFCFNGEPKALFIVSNRFHDERLDFFDINFNHMPFKYVYDWADEKIEKPTNFDEMKKIASILSEGFPFVRVDLYNVNGKVYFSELTLYPGNGRNIFQPEEWDYTFGDWLKLPETIIQ